MLRAEIIGHLGQDSEIKKLGNFEYISFSVASSKKKKDKAEETTWVQVLKRIDKESTLVNFLKKGCKVYVRGEITCGAYISKIDNQPKATMSIFANELELVGARENTGTKQYDSPDSYNFNDKVAPIPEAPKDELTDNMPF